MAQLGGLGGLGAHAKIPPALHFFTQRRLEMLAERLESGLLQVLSKSRRPVSRAGQPRWALRSSALLRACPLCTALEDSSSRQIEKLRGGWGPCRTCACRELRRSLSTKASAPLQRPAAGLAAPSAVFSSPRSFVGRRMLHTPHSLRTAR